MDTMILSLNLDSVKAKGLSLNSEVIEKTQRALAETIKHYNVV